jgi:hypothetical protein
MSCFGGEDPTPTRPITIPIPFEPLKSFTSNIVNSGTRPCQLKPKPVGNSYSLSAIHQLVEFVTRVDDRRFKDFWSKELLGMVVI